MTRWTVVTVTYNSRTHLERHWEGADRRDFEWIVVDNGSTDGTLETAAALADRVIESGGNIGFGRANNIGLRELTSEYVMFVNPDVRITGDWQVPMQLLADQTRGLVAPQLMNTDGSEQANARGVPMLGAKIRNRLDPQSEKGARYARSGFAEPTYCAWVMGAAVGGRTDVWRELGGWDEQYFLYYEDHEIGLRAWKNDKSVVLDPAVRWTHEWQRATSKPSAWAWKVELASMRTFFGDHPEFALGSGSSGLSRKRVRRAGYARMQDLLWQPLVERDVT